jgi:FtsP/CotA-like multicopper oxidase with cupredoxin domain
MSAADPARPSVARPAPERILRTIRWSPAADRRARAEQHWIEQEDSMKRELLATCIAVTVGLATAGCASTQTDQADTELGEGQTTVEVTNNHEQPVTVQAVSSAGEDRRLGQVAADRTERFTLPASVSDADLRIQVDPVGSTESYLSPQISVGEGDVVTVRVEANLAMSTVSVR